MRRIYIDMDEVLSNFKKLHQQEKSEYNLYPQSRPGFFNDLEPIDGGVEAVKKLMVDNDVFILTAPSYMNPHCYTDKRLWIERHFGLEFCKKLIISYHKDLLIGDVLIDDSKKNGQLNFQGEVIEFGSDNFPNWEVVMEHLAKPIVKKGSGLCLSDIDDTKMDSFFEKLVARRNFDDRWESKLSGFVNGCTPDYIEKYIRWENKYQEYNLTKKHIEASSNIFNILLSVIRESGEDVLSEYELEYAFLEEAYKFRGYTLMVFVGQGVAYRIMDSIGNNLL